MHTTTESRTKVSRRSSLATRILVTIAIGVALYYSRAAVAPVALAVLFSLLLTAPVEALHHRGVPRATAAILVLALLMSLIGGAANLLWTPAQSWWAAAPQTLKIVEERSRPISLLLGRVEELTASASEIGRAPAEPSTRTAAPGTRHIALASQKTANGDALNAAMAESNFAVQFLDGTRDAVISLITLGLTMLFLLSGGPPMLARICALLAGTAQASHSLRVVEAVRSEVSRYYASVALINFGLGLATTSLTMLLGMPNPLLWGSVAALLNFIPYVGSTLTLLLLTLVALVTFDHMGQVVAVTASYLAVATLEGQVVQPLVLGRRLKLSPIIVFLALWFGGWFWGIAGIVIAVPALISLKVVAQHSARGRALTELLGPEDSTRRSSAEGGDRSANPATVVPRHDLSETTAQP